MVIDLSFEGSKVEGGLIGNWESVPQAESRREERITKPTNICGQMMPDVIAVEKR